MRDAVEIAIVGRVRVAADEGDPHGVADGVGALIRGLAGDHQAGTLLGVVGAQAGFREGRCLDRPAALIPIRGGDLVAPVPAGDGHGGRESPVLVRRGRSSREVCSMLVVLIDRRGPLGDEVVAGADLLAGLGDLDDAQGDRRA